LQLYDEMTIGMDEFNLPRIPHHGVALPIAKMLRRRRKDVALAFEESHGGFGALRRNQKVDVPCVLRAERAIGKLCERNALKDQDGDVRRLKRALKANGLCGQD
jgi:hypothetical protein